MTPTREQILSASAGWVSVVLNVIPSWVLATLPGSLEGLLDHCRAGHGLVCGRRDPRPRWRCRCGGAEL